MDDEPENVSRLPVKYIGPIPDRSILAPWEAGKNGACSHLMVSYIVDEAKAHVECGACHEPLNPMWVLKQLSIHDRRSAETIARAREVHKRLDERVRTKCDHCKKMTRIRRV